MKRRHLLLMALSLILSICMCFGLAACSSCDDDDAPAKLSTPVVTIDNAGVASWLEVENASGYAFVIDNGAETATTKLSVTLTDGQTIKVKAKGDGTSYSDSDFSEVQTYTAPAAQPTQLSAPEVTIGDDGTVTIGTVANAVKIVYAIGDGAETDYDANNKPVLEEGQTIKVTAKGDGTNYSDSTVVTKTRPTTTPATVMTHAEFVAAAKDSDVLVQGVVTIISGKNVFFSDDDGGYYAYNIATVPENLAVGMTVKVTGKKDIFNGLNQVKNGGTLEIVDTEVKTVTPVDITEVVTNMTSLEELNAYQNMLVVVKGITLAEFDGNYFKFTLGTVEVAHYVGGSSQVVSSDDQAAYKQLFADNAGKTADLTCVVGAYNNPQLVPASTNPLSNIRANLTKLTAPTVSVDQETGIATFVKADDVSYVYKIGEDGTETPVPENGEIQLEKGQTVFVKAKGDGTTTDDSEWSVGKTYSDVDPDTLPALDKPVITVNENGTFSWTAVTGASGYKYKVGDGQEVEVNAETLSITNAPLTAGQTVQVKAVGDMVTNKDSEYETAKYVKKLPAPTVEISLSGVVTITADENATKVVYVIGDGEEADYDAESKPTLTNGQTIKVTAKGDGEAYSDSVAVEKTFTEIEVMSYATFMSNETAVGTTVAVTGTVTAFRGKSVYFQDTDGGYYAYNATNVPENLEVGMTVKVVGVKAANKGLTQINTATIEITDETVALMAPVDITTAGITTLDELAAYQNRLVVIKGITVAAFSGSNYTFKLGDLDIPVYVGGTSQIVDSNGQAAFKKAFNDNIGKTGDLTCIVSIYNTAQLVPANTTPLSNLQGAAICAKPVVTISDSGLATWTAVAGAVKYSYKVNDGTAQEISATATLEVQLNNNDFIVVQAVGDGTEYTDSDWSDKKTYRQFNVSIGTLVKATATTVLKAGDVIAITNSDGTKTLKLGEKENNRDETAFAAKPSNEVMLIILEAGSEEGKFLMRTKQGYLYAASSDANYLKLKDEPDADCEWTITVAATGFAAITGQGQFSRNLLKYNSSSKIFSCYGSGQGEVCVYVNVKATKLPKPVLSIDEDGYVTITNYDAISANAQAIYFHIGEDDNDHSNDGVYDPANKPQLAHNEMITVTAKGDAVYFDSNFATATYDETPHIVKLSAPTVTIDRATGLVTITPQGENTNQITGYDYTVFTLDGENRTVVSTGHYNPAEDEDIYVDEDGQWIEVKAIGQRRFKDSDYCEAVQFEESEEATALDTPTMSVDKDGYVTFSATTGSGYTYKIKKVGDEDFGEEKTATKAAGNQPTKLTVALDDGAQIMVKANKIATEELQLDSPWSETPLTYQAPGERTEVPTDFDFTMVTVDNQNKVKLTFTAASGVEYTLTVGTTPVTKSDDGYYFDIDGYTAITLTVLGNAPAGSLTSGDFHTYFKDKELNLKEEYETQFYNAYTELNAITVKGRVISEETITLPATGTADTNVAFTWEPVGTLPDCATLTGNSLTINPSNAAAGGSTVTIKVTVTGKTYLTRTFDITVETVKETTIDFSKQNYTSGQPISPTTVTTDFVTVTFKKNNGSTAPSFYDDAIRLYGSGTLEVSSTKAIEKIEFVFGDKDGTNAITCDKGSFATDTWTGNETEIVFTVASGSGNRRFSSMKITYARSDTERISAAISDLSLKTEYSKNFTVDVLTASKVKLTWSVTKTNSGDGSLSIDNTTGVATVVCGDAETTFSITATASIDGSTAQSQTSEPFTVTIPKKSNTATPPEPETHALNLTDGFANGYGAGSAWSSTYAAHTIYITSAWGLKNTATTDSDLGTISFTSADKQSSSVTDCPVFKSGTNGPVVKMGDGYTITAVTFTLKQYTTKTYSSIKIEYSTDGTNWTASDNLHTSGKLGDEATTKDFSLTITAENVKYVRVNIGGSNQIGVSAISLTVVPVA